MFPTPSPPIEKVLGHEICILDNKSIRFMINVPWSIFDEPDTQRLQQVRQTTESIARYLMTEEVIPPRGMNIFVFTNHPDGVNLGEYGKDNETPF